jgi:antitoxin component YwqK of YwqJK toxin-antitoxin module
VSKDNQVFDGLRFTVPEKLEGRDFIWYFNAPKHWGNWYIVPVEGELERGFRNWLDADKAYQGLDDPKEKDRLRILQDLSGSNLKAGKDYILWFRRVGEGPPSELRGVLAFAARAKDEEQWKHEALETALKLQPSPVEVQAEVLASRGAKILLDPAFFDRPEADERIDQVFFDIRQTVWTRGGYFITMEIACPPCHHKPSFAKIEAVHGAPDFIESDAEKARLRKLAGDTNASNEDAGTVTYYYDYFGFEVQEGDPARKVRRVRTQASNYADLRAPDDKPFFGRLPMKNLTVFRDRQKEVGRLYFFNEGEKKPVIMQEPPPGRYRSGDQVLEYQGQGAWLWLTMSGDKVVRRIPFAQHLIHGRGEGKHENGKTSFTAEYKNGVLDGEVVKFGEDGKVTSKQLFREGRPVP